MKKYINTYITKSKVKVNAEGEIDGQQNSVVRDADTGVCIASP